MNRGLIFDCVYDQYRGVVIYIKVTDGYFASNQRVDFVYSEKTINISEVGFFDPHYHSSTKLGTGEIGYIVTGQKSVRDIKIGDTIISDYQENIKSDYNLLHKYVISGFARVKPYVYAGVYPVSNNQFEKLRESFEKLVLNDSAVEYEYENNKALGYGFRCGFLGMLHMDIIKERISREFDIETVFTTPNVIYLVKCKTPVHEKIIGGTNVLEIIRSGMRKYIFEYDTDMMEYYIDHDMNDDMMSQIYMRPEYDHHYQMIKNMLYRRIVVRSGADMPSYGDVDTILEPMTHVEVVGPSEYYGFISELCQDYRGELKSTGYIDDDRVLWKYTMPLGEIIVDFYDKLKGLSKGYATMNYEFIGYTADDLVKMDIMIHGEVVDSFSMIVHRSKAYNRGSDIVTKLKDLIPKHMFAIPIQAALGNKIIARENISAMRKDVIAKCYGGDVSRKRKLLEKQKEGKKKMKEIGKVSIPTDIFIKMVVR